MSRFFIGFLIFSFAISRLEAQSLDSTITYKFSKIGWEISLPAKYKQTDEGDRKRMVETGTKAALIKPFNLSDGDWLETLGEQNRMFAKTLTVKFPDYIMDTLTSRQSVSGTEFIVFNISLKIKKEMPNLKFIMFAALINGYNVGVNFMYFDTPGASGKEFLNYFLKSKFTADYGPIKPGVSKPVKIDVKE